jgi:hypothetical protein
MVEADIHLRPLHTSILDINKVFESLVRCLKAIWLHPYTVTPAKLAPDLGSQGPLRSENDAITSWLRLILTSDLRPIHKSIFGIYTVFEPLVHCLKVIWLHSHTVTPFFHFLIHTIMKVPLLRYDMLRWTIWMSTLLESQKSVRVWNTTRLGGIMVRDFYSYSILRTIVLVPPTPLLPELLRSLVSTMAAAGSSALPSPVSGRRPN